MTTPIKKTVLSTLAGGGHLWESISLLQKFQGKYDLHFVTAKQCLIPDIAIIKKSKVHTITDIGNFSRDKMWQRAYDFAKSFLDSYILMRKLKPHVVVAVGTSLSLPVFVAAKLLGIPAVFIESITRVEGLSKTGEIIQKYGLAKRCYVQWPEAEVKNKDVFYKGSVL